MNRDQFIKGLEQLLSDIPEEERREAISYYEDYFDDAGEENEEAVLAELKSPEHVARSIKADLQGTAAGGFTEKGYEEFQEREVPAKRGAEDSYAGDENSSNTGRVQKEAENQKKATSQNNAQYDKKAEYRGPFEYNQSQGSQNPYQQHQYNQKDSYADKREDGSARKGQQAEYGKSYQAKRDISRRPVWATALLLFAGIVVIVVLAFTFGISILAAVALLGAGIGFAAFAAPAAGIALIGIGLVFLAIFMIALLAEILFCRRIMPKICHGRRKRL